MRVLVACEYSGVVSQAFRDNGHDALITFLHRKIDGRFVVKLFKE